MVDWKADRRTGEAREFYTAEALRGGWKKRQLYERTLLSRNKMTMFKKGQFKKPEDVVTPEEEIKDPFVLKLRFLPPLIE